MLAHPDGRGAREPRAQKAREPKAGPARDADPTSCCSARTVQSRPHCWAAPFSVTREEVTIPFDSGTVGHHVLDGQGAPDLDRHGTEASGGGQRRQPSVSQHLHQPHALRRTGETIPAYDLTAEIRPLSVWGGPEALCGNHHKQERFATFGRVRIHDTRRFLGSETSAAGLLRGSGRRGRRGVRRGRVAHVPRLNQLRGTRSRPSRSSQLHVRRNHWLAGGYPVSSLDRDKIVVPEGVGRLRSTTAHSRRGEVSSALGHRVKVLLVDPDTLVRKALAQVLTTCVEGAEVTEARDAEEALGILVDTAHDVALVSIGPPGGCGIDLLRGAHETWPEMPVIILTDSDSGKSVRAALSEGAAGYLLNDVTPEALAQATLMALSGSGSMLSPQAIRNLTQESAGSAGPDRRETPVPNPPLTPREADVLRLVPAGATNREISRKLFLSEKTVKAHLASVFRKLGVSNRTQAAMAAIAMGIGGHSATDSMGREHEN
jgi:DNA-binding NarL/FixJ family response regulator